MNFDFGQTPQSDAFFALYPKFLPAFDLLIKLSNQCFGRASKAKNALEDICFGLGHTCREDFLEVTFLCINDHGGGALKILRGLYERAVTLEHIIKNPDKIERFIKYAAVQEHKALNAMLKTGISEQEWDKDFSRENTAAKIRDNYNRVKSEFQMTTCKECKTQRLSHTWDTDIAAMVDKIGYPYDKLYLAAYSLPTSRIHATLSSANIGSENDRIRWKRQDSDLALSTAFLLMTYVIAAQNKLFSLQLDQAEIDICERSVLEVWPRPLSDQP